MTNDSATTRLLYAILSQKCLKDIDWNKVASNPIICGEITNGHAARMRYSRFKKQMDGNASVKRHRNTPSPKKVKVEKKVPSKKVKEKSSEVKTEESSSQDTLGTPAPEPELHGLGLDMGQIEERIVKRESSEMRNTYPMTPSDSHIQSQTQTPSPGFGEMGGMSQMAMDFSGYGMQDGMYQEGYEMGLQMGMEGYDWQQPHDQAHNVGILVKREPRWEETYRPV